MIFFYSILKHYFRETKAYYSVIVTATDNGLIPFARSSTSTLVIYVTDENDNAPILEKTEYEFYLTENSPADTVIGRVSAYDLDLGRNAEITYKFAIENDRFEIDKQSGFISSKIVIDRENMATSSEFDIEVIVSDQGLVAQTAVAKVLISILDENDNKPVFSQDTYQAEISEGNFLGVCLHNLTYILHNYVPFMYRKLVEISNMNLCPIL